LSGYRPAWPDRGRDSDKSRAIVERAEINVGPTVGNELKSTSVRPSEINVGPTVDRRPSKIVGPTVDRRDSGLVAAPSE
jgi:hypothetical protein